MHNESSLAGARVLVAEDSLIVARELQATLEDLGCIVFGPYGKLEQVVDAITRQQFDLAVLDVDLRGENIFPAADMLVERNTPFIFSTGFNSGQIPDRYSNCPHLEKPTTKSRIVHVVRQQLGC